MGIDKIIVLGTAMALAAALSGQLPRAVLAVQIAELKLLKDSQASGWPKAYLLPDERSFRQKSSIKHR